MDGTVLQRCIYKFKIEVRTCIPAIQLMKNQQDKLGNNKKVTNFYVVFSDRK